MFLSELDNFTQFDDIQSLIWYIDDITFGSWSDGPYQDGSRIISIDLDVPEVIYYCTWENFGRRKHWRIVSNLPKFLTDTLKMYLAYTLTVAYSPNFSSPIILPLWFTKIFPCQILPVYGIL